MKKLSFKFILAILLFEQMIAIPPTNLFLPYDPLLITPRWSGSRFELFSFYEGSFKVNGYQDVFVNENVSSKKVNPLQLWQDEQDSIAAFKRFPVQSSQGQISQALDINDDNLSHGIYQACGKFDIKANFIFGAKFHFDYGISLNFFLPYYIMELKNVSFIDHSNNTAFEKLVVPDSLANIRQYGNLTLSGWKRHGPGDLLIQAIWLENFYQARPFLKNVTLNCRFGAMIPTGQKANENVPLGIPFGNDGSLGLIIAGGIDLHLGRFLKAGVDANFLYIFGNTKCRRVKTDLFQTDLFLLNKIETYKHFGFTQQFTIYGQLNMWRGLSLKAAYQFIQHDRDRVFPYSNFIAYNAANSAQSNDEWVTNSIIVNLIYDFQQDLCCSRFKPYASLFMKKGFSGRRALLADTVGLLFTVSF